MYNESKTGVPVRETEITKVMVNLSKAVECMGQSVEATEARLTGVTRGGLKEGRDKAADSEYCTPLAQDINKIHDRIQDLRVRLDDLLSRVEL